MKRLLLLFGFILTFSLFWATPTYALEDYEFKCNGDTNDFYFEDFTADYYLTRDDKGISHLRVVERLTAVFPECDQNRGIVREIPFTNRGGANVTLPTPILTATRNGEPENIAKIETSGNVYLVYLGNASEYVYGRQEYILEYEFEKVITDFTSFQELYWDTNGTGWSQPFESLTVNLHMNQELSSKIIRQDTSCYVGKYGDSSQERCYSIETTDGYSFSTFDLDIGENLTFAIRFDADTFTIPELPRSWMLVAFAILEVIILALSGWSFYRKTWKPTAEKRHWYKYAPVAPQYTPLKGYTVGELSAVYIGSIKDSRVATLLELAVANKISLRKEDGKFKKTWYVKVKSISNLTAEQLDILKTIANQSTIKAGEEYKMKSHGSSDTSASIASRSYDGDVRSALKKRGDIEYEVISHTNSLLSTLFNSFVIIAFLTPFFTFFVFGAVILITEEIMNIKLVNPGLQIIGYEYLPLYMIFGGIVVYVVLSILKARCVRFEERTMNGLKSSIYMEGLRHYIGLAESARIEFLQSVKGADTTPTGIVKLHEKLLPYAVVFGMEKSWMAELAHYYETVPETNPDWVVGAAYLSASDFSSAISSARSSSYASIPSSSGSSSGGSSSGSSGGGGGGFSGGGGGGGGGGGW